MKIQWLGQSCFLMVSGQGVWVLADPFDPKIGYRAPAVPADIVTTSHAHGDHNYIQAVQGKFDVVNQPGETNLHGIPIKGISSFHDDTRGSQRGQNILFRFTIDGLNVLHCGDLGHLLSPEQVQAIGPVDVLLIPVGGHYTIDAATAVKVMKQLNPALTIPMHFRTPAVSMPIETIEPFLREAGGGKKIEKTEMEVTKETLPQPAGIIVLDYPH